MSIQTRRNAIVGWATIMLGKYFARKKAAEIVEPKRSRLLLKIGAVVAAGVAVGGAVAFWRRSKPDDVLDETLDEVESEVEVV
jgi:hypothetical protein